MGLLTEEDSKVADYINYRLRRNLECFVTGLSIERLTEILKQTSFENALIMNYGNRQIQIQAQ